MTADALDPPVARLSAVVVLNILDKQVLIFHEEGFWNTVKSLIEDAPNVET